MSWDDTVSGLKEFMVSHDLPSLPKTELLQHWNLKVI